MQTRLPALSSPSFALISVLALVSLAALTATAFLASARLERQATRPLGETARLEMACTSAKECASQTLNLMCEPKWHTIATYWRGTNTNDWTNELGYLLLGRPNSTSNVRWTYFCGFNTALHKKLDTNVFLIEMTNTNPWLFLAEIGGNMAKMTNGFVTNPTSTDTNCTLIPLLGGRTSPPVGWTYIYQDKKIANSTNTTNVPVARFSYYMEDLSGLIDAERMGGSDRTTGTNASEISLTNLFTNWSSNSIIKPNNYDQFINVTNRAKYFSPALMLYANTNISTNDLRYFAHGLLSWNQFPNTIPVGVPITGNAGYIQGGQLKLNLNSAPNPTVGSIAAAINTNLPAFTNRAGGMNGTAYVNNIAANIIDYIDPDSTPTVDVGDNPTYLGIENIPWPNELFDRITFTEVTSAGLIRIELKDYVEVWNMGNSNIPSGTTITLSNNYDMVLTMTNRGSGTAFAPVFFKTNLTNFTTESGSFGLRQFALSSPLLPNGYQVLESSTDPSTRRLSFQIPNTISSAYWTDALVKNNWAIFSPSADITANMTYTALIGGKVIQKSISGRSPRFLAPSFAIRPPSGTYIFCNNIGYASQSTASSTTPRHTGGDPRAQLFLNGILYQQNYTNQYATPGGRNRTYYWQPGGFGPTTGSGPFPESEVNPAKYWPDNGHATNSDYGANPTSCSQSPTSFPPVTPITNNYVMIRNDTGTLTNILELGNIYDPMQWSDLSGSGVASQPGLWTNLTAAATKDTRYGGRNTLRIGRPEHPRFAFTDLGGPYPVPNMGRSAAALLDLFSSSDSYDNGGRINLNTAPAPVLRALAGGIALSNDLAMTPSSTLAIPNRMTEAFAQGVMRYRSIYPFLSQSQLAFIATDYGKTNGTDHWTNTWPKNAVFGNTNPTIALDTSVSGIPSSWTTASNGVTEWNDQASEEWFSKIYNLSTVQSWNYRTYVVAQLVNSNGLPTGPTMRKYSLMYIRYNGTFSAGISAGPFISFESPY
jgi:hypothetical protein